MERIELEKAVKRLIENVSVNIEDEWVDILHSGGRVLSKDVEALHHQPPFDRSPLDGYAVKGADTSHATFDDPIRLEVIDEVCAGRVSDMTLKEGQAIRIMTGGPMPKGSDGVIRQEDTDMGEAVVKIYKGIKTGQNYCFAGEDFKAGEILFETGTLMDAYKIGMLASNGISKVKVKKKLKVGLISTGDELVEPGKALHAGKIYNSNLYTLSARLIELGCDPHVIGTIGDDVNLGMSLIEEHASKVDMIVTTGGVSVGKMDIMHPIYKGLGLERLFWKVNLRPGTPALAGLYNNTLVLSLSGNPSACAITFELLFRPLFSHLKSCKALNLRRVNGFMIEAFNKKSPTRRMIKATMSNGQVELTKGCHSSGVLRSMIGCNCLIDVAAGSDALDIGDEVEIIMF